MRALLLHGAAACCCCMLLLHGAAAWCCCMVLLHGAAAWCCCILLLNGAAAWGCCIELLDGAAAWCCCYCCCCCCFSGSVQRQQQQFFSIKNRGGRRSGAGDIWQISGNPAAPARRCVSGGTLGRISAIKRSFAQANYDLQRRYRNPVRGHHLPSATIYAALIFNWAVFDINDISYILIISVFYLPNLCHIFSAFEFCLCVIVVS